jgi:hypothetical protein
MDFMMKIKFQYLRYQTPALYSNTDLFYEISRLACVPAVEKSHAEHLEFSKFSHGPYICIMPGSKRYATAWLLVRFRCFIFLLISNVKNIFNLIKHGI